MRDERLLLDELMPRYDVVERHATIVRAAPGATYAAIREADLAGGPIARTLLAIRAVPAALLLLVTSPQALVRESRARRTARGKPTRLADFERHGFRVVAERAPEELVIGLLGRFWTPRGGVCHDVSAATFAMGPPNGQALAGWNFTVVARDDGRCELRTETRVWCAPEVRWKFRLYWLVVRPGSGVIRREMLRAIRRTAERASSVMSPLEN
jgi:hypothetical protein